jgi:hypothetical protein
VSSWLPLVTFFTGRGNGRNGCINRRNGGSDISLTQSANGRAASQSWQGRLGRRELGGPARHRVQGATGQHAGRAAHSRGGAGARPPAACLACA